MNFSHCSLSWVLWNSLDVPFSRYSEPYERLGDFGFPSDEKNHSSPFCGIFFSMSVMRLRWKR